MVTNYREHRRTFRLTENLMYVNHPETNYLTEQETEPDLLEQHELQMYR